MPEKDIEITETTELYLHCAKCGCGKLEIVVKKEEGKLLIGCPECVIAVAVMTLPDELRDDVNTQGCHECGCGKEH